MQVQLHIQYQAKYTRNSQTKVETQSVGKEVISTEGGMGEGGGGVEDVGKRSDIYWQSRVREGLEAVFDSNKVMNSSAEIRASERAWRERGVLCVCCDDQSVCGSTVVVAGVCTCTALCLRTACCMLNYNDQFIGSQRLWLRTAWCILNYSDQSIGS